MTIAAIAIATKMVTCKKKKKLWKEGSKYETKGERGAVKKKFLVVDRRIYLVRGRGMGVPA